MSDAQAFIEAVFGVKIPEGLRVELFHLSTKRVDSIVFPNAVDAIVPRAKNDLYVTVGYTRAKPATGRSKEAAIAGIPAFWVDFDVNGGPDGKTNALPTLDDALALASAIAPPTLLVNSGYGLHAWWVLDEPWIFADDLDRRRAKRAVQLWQQAHRERMLEGKLDATHDLARLMRLPGTLNAKDATAPAPVAAIPGGSGQTYALGDLVALVAGASVSDSAEPEGAGVAIPFAPGSLASLDAPARAGVDDLVIDPNARPPSVLFDGLRDLSPDFDTTWTRKASRKTKDWSHSEWDLSLGSQAAHAGWSRQEVADLLIFARSVYDAGGAKGTRADYIVRTVERIFSTVRVEQHEERTKALEERKRQARITSESAAMEMDELADRAEAGEDVTLETLAAFNRVIGGESRNPPRVVSIVQESKEHQRTRYTLTFASGDVLSVGARQLSAPGEFSVALMAATVHVMPGIKLVYWQQALRALLAAAEVHASEESSSLATVRDAIEAYCEHATQHRDDDVVAAGSPFVDKDGNPRFTTSGLRGFVARRPGFDVPASEIAAVLRTLGWRSAAVTYRTRRGEVTSKAYYALTVEAKAKRASE